MEHIQLGTREKNKNNFKERKIMYVRLGLANPKEGMAEDALLYFQDVAIPVYDQVSGLLGAAACINLSLIHISEPTRPY